MEYQKETDLNKIAFYDLVRVGRPDLFSILTAIDETHVNYIPIVTAIYALERIGNGSKYGEVRIQVQNGVVTFVLSDEARKLNEVLLTNNETSQ